MKRPYICFFGDEKKCRSIMDRFNDAESVFIKNSRRIEKTAQVLRRRPAVIFIIPGKGQSMNSNYFASTLKLSFKYKTPVFAVCSDDQFFTFKNASKGGIVYRSSLTGIGSIIREAIRFFAQNRKADLLLIKANFTPVAVISDNAVLASFAESKICPESGTNNRFVLISPDCKEPENCFTIPNSYPSYIFTANRDGSIPDCLYEMSEKAEEEKTSLIYLSKGDTPTPNGKIVRTDIYDKNDTIAHELRKKRTAKIRRIYRMVDEKE